MQKIKNLSSSAVILLAALTFTFSVPVFAESGTSGSGDDSQQTSTTQTSAKPTTETEHQQVQTDREQVKSDKVQLAADKQTLKQNVEAQKQEHKSAEKVKVCQSRKQGLTNKFNHITTNATNIDTRISDVLTKAEKYQQEKNVNAADFASLDATAQADGQKAAEAIANLKAVTPSIDCNSTSVSSDVATFKTSAASTRDALKTYRQAVIAVLHSLEQAKAASKTTTSTGGNQ